MGTEREEIELRQGQLDGKAALSERHPVCTKYVIEHDGFAGHVIGYYVTDEGKEGVVLQQEGTRVVHVYGTKWLKGI